MSLLSEGGQTPWSLESESPGLSRKVLQVDLLGSWKKRGKSMDEGSMLGRITQERRLVRPLSCQGPHFSCRLQGSLRRVQARMSAY